MVKLHSMFSGFFTNCLYIKILDKFIISDHRATKCILNADPVSCTLIAQDDDNSNYKERNG